MSVVLCLPAHLRVSRSVPWPAPHGNASPVALLLFTCVLFWGAHKSLAPRARTLLGGLEQATLSFFAAATLLFFFFCECPKFCDLAKQRRKMFGGVSEVGKDNFSLSYFWWCVVFLVFFSSAAIARRSVRYGTQQMQYYSREDLSVELFASDKQHVLDLYCSKGKNCSYKFYWPSFGMAYENPRFSKLGKVLTKVALERFCMVLCSPDWRAHGGNEYWRTLLDRLTISSVRLPDEAIYVPLGRKTPIGKPGWGSMLSMVDGGLTSIP